MVVRGPVQRLVHSVWRYLLVQMTILTVWRSDTLAITAGWVILSTQSQNGQK